jgi:hypothetical protein
MHRDIDRADILRRRSLVRWHIDRAGTPRRVSLIRLDRHRRDEYAERLFLSSESMLNIGRDGQIVAYYILTPFIG